VSADVVEAPEPGNCDGDSLGAFTDSDSDCAIAKSLLLDGAHPSDNDDVEVEKVRTVGAHPARLALEINK
jgi:hypothetical protein